MKLACRLINGDGIGFEYAIVELTPDYVTDLLRMVGEAKRLKEMDATFCEIEFMDYGAEYGSSLGGLEDNLPEFGEGKKWIEVPDDFQWPKDSQQSVASSSVAVTKGTLFWRALGSHDFGGPYFESDELDVEELRRLFPQKEEEKQKTETRRYVLFDHDMGDLATTNVYSNHGEAVEDASQLDNVIVLALAFEKQDAPECECQQPGTWLAECPAEASEEQPTATGECVFSFPVYYDRDITDPEALGCAFDRLLDTAMSTPGILDEYGNPTIGTIYLGPDNETTPICECEQPGNFCSGVPGILARIENGQLAEGAKVERCDSCQRYPSDKAAFEKLVELGMVSNEKQYIQHGGGFCPNCRSDQIEGDSVDFDGRHCTQRMRCLECESVWFDVYILSSVELR